MGVFICESLYGSLVLVLSWYDSQSQKIAGRYCRFLFLFWQSVLCLLLFTLPFLNNAVAGFLEFSSTFFCCKKSFFSGLVAVSNFSPIVWKTRRQPCQWQPWYLNTVLWLLWLGNNRPLELQESTSHRRDPIKHDKYAFYTAFVCDQASGSMMPKFGFCCWNALS